MNDRHRIHLVVGHVPLFGVIIGLALLGWGWARRSAEIKQASMGLFVICAVGAAAAVLSGQAAKQRVSELPGIDMEAIKRHAIAGKTAAIVTYVLGLTSLVALIWTGRTSGQDNLLQGIIVLVALLAAALLARVSKQGGEIRHPELVAKEHFNER